MTNLTDPKTKKHIVFQPELFPDVTMPNGWLHEDVGCQALWYYTYLVKRLLNDIEDTMQYDDVWPTHIKNARQLFSSVALLYGVAPERMVKFWKNVDMQCLIMKSPRVPKEFRFDDIPELRTQ